MSPSPRPRRSGSRRRRTGRPHEAIEALARGGLYGLVSAREVGGAGAGLRAAAEAVEQIARACGSAAMITCVHDAGATVIEKHGDLQMRRDIAAVHHLSTLAFSEAGARSMFWAPVSTASRSSLHTRNFR